MFCVPAKGLRLRLRHRWQQNLQRRCVAEDATAARVVDVGIEWALSTRGEAQRALDSNISNTSVTRSALRLQLLTCRRCGTSP